jgi:hypothetical protein
LAANKDYSGELVWSFIRKGYETMRKGKNHHLTDANGTDLRWSIGEEEWKRY